jgi:hypothetical protein
MEEKKWLTLLFHNSALSKVSTHKIFSVKITLIVLGRSFVNILPILGEFWWLTTCPKRISKLFENL